MKKIVLLIAALVTGTVTAQCWETVTSGADFNIGLKTDGSLYSWGYNESGQLGIGSTENKNLPTQIGSDSDWKVVSAGYGFTAALKNNGTLWVWGRNDFGLGSQTGQQANSPVQVGADSDWKSVIAGGAHAFAIKNDGTLWAWGRNDFGQLGLGDFTHRNIPVQVGTGTDWKTVKAGNFHTLAVKNDNTIWSWGYNFSGQLGQGTAGFGTELAVPTQIMALAANEWKCIAASGRQSMAIDENGRLWMWGNNAYGALGINDGSTYKSLPALVNNNTNWQFVAGGINHTIAIKADGTTWAWGENVGGQLGDGSIINRPTPVQIGTSYGIADGGERHSVFLKGGEIYVTGSNTYGQLGIGEVSSHSTPQQVQCPALGIAMHLAQKVTVYPNPVSEELLLQNYGIIIDEIMIRDVTGKTVMKFTGNIDSIDVKLLQSGVYWLQIYSRGEKSDFKFIKS